MMRDHCRQLICPDTRAAHALSSSSRNSESGSEFSQASDMANSMLEKSSLIVLISEGNPLPHDSPDTVLHLLLFLPRLREGVVVEEGLNLAAD